MLDEVIVPFRKLEAAFNKVRKELVELGLLYAGSPLDEVNCYHEGFSELGLKGLVTGTQGCYSFDDGNIHIPAVYVPRLLPFWYARRQMLDVLRHEFGHALEDRYGKWFCDRSFRAAFGADYGEIVVFKGGDWTSGYVTEYASSMTREDFAETFMLYMKHKGKLPARYRGLKKIEKKWTAVDRIVKKIAR